MGYYTRHELTVTNGGEVDHEEAIGELSQYGSGLFDGESVKWYKCDDQMKMYSKKYPDALFEIHGEGEESGDIWKSYFKNGKFHTVKAEITFDAYDESKLK